MLLVCGGLVNGPYALITTAVSADLVSPSDSSLAGDLTCVSLTQRLSPLTSDRQGTHKSLKGNARALSTVTAIIDGTGSVGQCHHGNRT